MYKDKENEYPNIEKEPKNNHQLTLKIDNLKGIISKTSKNNMINNWKNHIPVYGWCEMNYPKYIKKNLIEKYQSQRKKIEKDLENRIEKERIEVELENEKVNLIKKAHNKNYRKNPEYINKEILDSIDNIVNPIDNSSENFGIKKNDQQYYRNICQKILEDKGNFIRNSDFSYNHNIVLGLPKKLLFELGYNNSLSILSTNTYNKKKYIRNINYPFEWKYSNIVPNEIMIGKKNKNEFTKPLKRIGDISFEEEAYETEDIKSLKRNTYEFIDNDSIKEILNDEVEKLSIENHYWLSQDVVSKIGRLASQLIDLNLRNLKINSSHLHQIVSYLKRISSLNISECEYLDENSLVHIKNYCQTLKSINCSGLYNVVKDSSLYLLGQIETLTEMNISRCIYITSKGMDDLIKNSKKNQLKVININGLRSLTGDSINSLIKHNELSLEELDMSNLIQESLSKSLSNISKCIQLRYLNISGSNIDDISSIINLNNLLSLNLSSNKLVNNEFSISLLHLKIKVLRLSNCLFLTSDFLEHLYKMEKTSLLLIEINRTPKIKQELIEKCIVKHSPNLRIIRSTNIEWNPDNIGLRIPLIPINFEKPFVKGMKNPQKKKQNDKNPISLYEKYLKENQPKTVLDFYSL